MKCVLSLLITALLTTASLIASDAKLTLVNEIPSERVIEVTQSNFQDLMHFSKPVIIEVYSSHCVYCKRLEPIFQELNQEMGAHYQFAKLSVDQESRLVDSFNVRGFPTILYINEGKEMGRHVGFMNKEKFKADIEKVFGAK